MGLPAYMRARTPADMHRVLLAADGGRVVGVANSDFTPSHMLVTQIGDTVYDTNRADPWDLVAEGPGVSRGRSAYGQASGFVAQTLEHRTNGQRYRAKRIEAFNFAAGSWSVLFPWRFDVGSGGWCIGNIRGPRPEDPFYGHTTSVTWGEDRGWACSYNGDGGFGFGAYGPVSNVDNWINMDTVWGSYDARDGRWRYLETGYNHLARTAWMTCSKRLDEGGGVAICAQQTALGPGDLTSPDYFATGCPMYGVERSWFDGAIGLPICVFLDDVAISRWHSRLWALPVLQVDLERNE